ncbi:AbrB/MazE/SpoVT family DNA-binding domain-containing protein, partial [bacterium]
RGQVVIPADAREELGFAPGDKLLVMRHPIHNGVMLFKLEAAREFMDEFRAGMDRVAARLESELLADENPSEEPIAPTAKGDAA